MASQISPSTPIEPNAPTAAKAAKEKVVPFPVGHLGKRELRAKLKATTNPAQTIQEFQESHSLHTMMAKAFGTIPSNKFKNTRKTTGTVETLDSDSVMKFLSHLGVRQHEVHKKISDSLLEQLREDIGNFPADQDEPLLELLQACWVYSTTISELRPVLWALLKKLGPDKVPPPVLIALTERATIGDKEASATVDAPLAPLKHAEIFKPLALELKQKCWEADWDRRRAEGGAAGATDMYEPMQYLEHFGSTVFFETISPHITDYLNNALLCELADRTFCATVAERRILTTQRRALNQPSAVVHVPAANATKTTAPAVLTSGKPFAKLRTLLYDKTEKSYRPNLLSSVVSMLMARHGSTEKEFMGGSQHLNCTLVADILLSAGGPLPKAYEDVLALTRTLDDVVQKADLSDDNLAKIQEALKLIFQPDQSDAPTAAAPANTMNTGTNPLSTASKSRASETNAPSTALRRQLHILIIAGLASMKDADPQTLFLNPVTDEIAPNYSIVIKEPMSMVTMEQKVENNAYNTISDWEADVKLMFQNCIRYNKGAAAKWFRDEAKRQAKIFEEEIFSKANRQYQIEVAKRNAAPISADDTMGNVDSQSNKRTKSGPEIHPLEPSTKKRKKEKEENQPSMPALAAMLLSDPFVVRILLARVLRELRRGVVPGQSLPCAHGVVPSILQILHVARWSKQICAVRGKKYFIPAAGFSETLDGVDDPITKVSFMSLRRYVPMLLRLLLEAELDRRVVLGGDLHAATQSTVPLQSPPPLDDWDGIDHIPVVVALLQDALLHVSQPGTKNETALAVTFPKFAAALHQVATPLRNDRAFFVALATAVLRHKAKLPRATRDALFNAWMSWLQAEGSMSSAAHECLISLLNDWSALGNVLLPRDALLRFCDSVVQTVDNGADETSKFAMQWKSGSAEFDVVKKQYERMLASLQDTVAAQWKEKQGLDDALDAADEMDIEPPRA